MQDQKVGWIASVQRELRAVTVPGFPRMTSGAVFGTQRRDDFAGAQRRPRMKANAKEVARTIVRSG